MSEAPRAQGMRHDGEMLCSSDAVSDAMADDGLPAPSPKVLRIFADGLGDHLQHVRRAASVVFASFASRLDSDLERKMLAALLFLKDGYNGSPSLFGLALGAPDDGKGLRLQPHETVAQYTVDFALYAHGPASGKKLKFAIECDGQYFHDRTPEQVARDKRRDRVLAEQGFVVIRFTEAEINKDVRACVSQVERIVDAAQSADIEHWHRDFFGNGGAA